MKAYGWVGGIAPRILNHFRKDEESSSRFSRFAVRRVVPGAWAADFGENTKVSVPAGNGTPYPRFSIP
jgi:hypothetical protein